MYYDAFIFTRNKETKNRAQQDINTIHILTYTNTHTQAHTQTTYTFTDKTHTLHTYHSNV